MPTPIHFAFGGGLSAAALVALVALVALIALVGPFILLAAAILPCLDLSCLEEAA